MLPVLSEFGLAARNLFRQPFRSIIALSAIFFGVVALLLSGGFIEWIFFAMREATVYSRLGHIQVTRESVDGKRNPSFSLLPDRSPEFTRIASVPGVRLITERLVFSGLISRGENTVPFLGEGVDPKKEESLSRLLHIVKGRGLSEGDTSGVILGQGLAVNLGADVGDQVVLLSTTDSGSINGIEARVRGLFFTVSKQYDDAALRISVTSAKNLLRVSGAHTWVVLLDKTEDTQNVLAALKKQFSQRSQNLRFTPWNELADFYNKTVALYSRQMNVVEMIIALIIVLSIANTMTRTVLERTGEIGTLMALGHRRRKILRLFLAEGLMLGLAGGLLGISIGWLLATAISFVGIPMPPAPGMSTGFSGEIRLTAGLVTTAFVIAVSTTIMASIYPAWKASRLNVVDALRHNR